MIRYIGKELKKTLGQKYTYMYFAGIIILILLANVAVVSFRLLYGNNEGTYAYNLLEYATWCFIIPYYTCIFIADICFGKDYPNPYIKNADTAKLSRTKVYLSKLIVSLLLGSIFLVVAIAALLLITLAFQYDKGLSAYMIKDFLGKAVIAIPLWLAGVSIAIMFLFAFVRKRNAFIAYFIVTLLIPRVIMFFAAEPFRIAAFRFVRTYTITQSFYLIPYAADPSRSVPRIIIIGIVYGILAAVIGLVIYNKKENYN